MLNVVLLNTMRSLENGDPVKYGSCHCDGFEV